MKFPVLLLLLASLRPSASVAKSIISTFSDTNCKDSLRSLEGPNGYPNGTCTDLRRNGPYGSLQVVGLDPGCTVTIYADNNSGDICSGYQEEIGPIECYNSTFVFYSFDFCDPGAAQSSDTPQPDSSKGSSTGAIVGGVVGGVLGLGIIIGVVVYMIMKKRRGVGRADGYQERFQHESDSKQRHEMAANEFRYPSSKRFVAEVEQPPVELDGQGMEPARDVKKH